MTPRDPLAAVERAAIGEEVAASLRHDLRNKLGAIRSAAFFLRRRVTGSDAWTSDRRVPRFFELMDEEIVKAVQLVESFSIAGAKTEPRPLACPLETAVEMARASAALPDGFAIETTAESVVVAAEPSEIALAIRSLLENACEAQGGSGRALVRARALEGVGCVEVEDEGPGFTQEARSEGVRPFFTTKPGHAGLGLSIASRIARRYGGSLEIAAAARTTVRICLPLVGARAAMAAEVIS